MYMKEDFILFAKKIFDDDFIPLHRPIFNGNERKYLVDCIDSNFVSSVGAKVNEFENGIAKFTNCNHAIATVNGTSALHIAIKLSGVKEGDEVLTQALTFIATCNAISYTGAKPVFIDVDKDTMGMSPDALLGFLKNHTEKRNGNTYNIKTRKKIRACVPMHTFGNPCRIEKISSICKAWGISLIEDCAESLGSYVGEKHTGNFGDMAIFSFNGNKLITTGGGGMIVTNDANLAKRAKHLTTTAKVAHEYEFIHDEIGYNYRMPNINAALGCAQMEKIDKFLIKKRMLANTWKKFFEPYNVDFHSESDGNKINYWLNTIIFESRDLRDEFLEYTNANNVMTRPIWKLMTSLKMFSDCQHDGLKNSKWLEDRVVNIPSSVPQIDNIKV
ncbi:LegC family aminotransferase [Gammaproteobacteria bacterium]|nr:LegC family aminotransferase [Gammaproteobacteria bacterium]